MKELLLSEINAEGVNPLAAVALIEAFIFGEQVSIEAVERMAEYCSEAMDDTDNSIDQAEQLINEIYVQHLFIDLPQPHWSVATHQLVDAFSFRVISPILKSIIIQHIIKLCGFHVDIVFVPEKIMVRIMCDDDFAIIFEPVTGQSISWDDLDERLADVEFLPNGDFVHAIEPQDLIYKYVASLKNALINEQKFDKALKCVDILLAMRPDDPFERRDRGFLLHQLDCFKVAYDDYRYFVEQCPQDPAARLLKLQLDNITVNNTILH